MPFGEIVTVHLIPWGNGQQGVLFTYADGRKIALPIERERGSRLLARCRETGEGGISPGTKTNRRRGKGHWPRTAKTRQYRGMGYIFTKMSPRRRNYVKV